MLDKYIGLAILTADQTSEQSETRYKTKGENQCIKLVIMNPRLLSVASNAMIRSLVMTTAKTAMPIRAKFRPDHSRGGEQHQKLRPFQKGVKHGGSS